jgi:hypothetical protein
MDPEEASGALPTDQTPGALAAGTEEDDASIGLSKAEMAKIAAIQGDYYKTARDKLAAARTGAPSQSEKWFAIAAALGAPTKTGSFGEQLGGVNKALAEYSSQKREAEGKRQSLLDQIDLQQTKGLGDLQQKYIIEAARQRGLNERAGNKILNTANYVENNRQLQARTYANGVDILDFSTNSPTFGQVIKSSRPTVGGPPAVGGSAPVGGPAPLGAPMVAPAGGPPAVKGPPPPSPPPPPVDLPPSLRRAQPQPTAVAQTAAQPVSTTPTTFIRGEGPSFDVPGVGMVQAGKTYTNTDKNLYIMGWDGVPKKVGDMSVEDQLSFAKRKTQMEASFQGQKSMDEKYAPQYLDWAQNKRAVSERNIESVQAVVDLLKLQKTGKGAPISGFWSLAMLPDKYRAYAGPKGLDAQQTVEQAVSQGIKDVLDSQFAAAEAQQYMRRAYDANLPPEMNIKKLEAYLKQARTGLEAKNNLANYWEQKQTLEGYKGVGVPKVFPPMPANPVVGERYSSANGRTTTYVIDRTTNRGKFVYVD